MFLRRIIRFFDMLHFFLVHTYMRVDAFKLYICIYFVMQFTRLDNRFVHQVACDRQKRNIQATESRATMIFEVRFHIACNIYSIHINSTLLISGNKTITLLFLTPNKTKTATYRYFYEERVYGLACRQVQRTPKNLQIYDPDNQKSFSFALFSANIFSVNKTIGAEIIVLFFY